VATLLVHAKLNIELNNLLTYKCNFMWK